MKRIVDLNGTWDFVADLDPKYHADARSYPEPPYASPEANRRHWQKVPVPGVWQKYGERYDIYEGVCWFAREFEVDSLAPGFSARLCFDGVNYLARVFLNGVEIGQHETGYTAFTLPATGQLKVGVNHLAVMVDNRAVVTQWPPVLGYFNYGGIHRDVRLEIGEGLCLENVQLGSAGAVGDANRLKVRGAVSGLVESAIDKDNGGLRPVLKVQVDCNGVTGYAEIGPDGSFEAELVLPGVRSWSPEEPVLYPVTVSLLRDGEKEDVFEAMYGFKRIEIRENKIYLNGNPLRVKGICYVYDSSVSGLVMTQIQVEEDVKLMKELGCNAVRCHYPMDEKFYAACDRYGILVWIEPTVYCYHPLDDETGTAFCDLKGISLAQQMVVEMIAAARNHPSVSIYGIGNECNSANPEAKDFFAQLAGLIRRLDPTRLVSYAALYGIVGPLGDMVDVLGVNSYWGWYDKVFAGQGIDPDLFLGEGGANLAMEPIDLTSLQKMLDEVLAKNRKDLILFLTEFGADSISGFHARGRDLWSENYHADLLREILKMAGTYPQIAGTFPFCFSDYRDPSKVHNGYWNELNLKGVVTYERRKKLAFDALKEAYEKHA